MPKLVKDSAIVECERTLLAKDVALSDVQNATDIVPLDLWLTNREGCKALGVNAIWIDSEQTVEALAEDLDNLTLVAIRFPTFMDGRGFSIGRLLRERMKFSGEIRAFGNVIQDQMHFLMRCGFNAMDLRPGTNLEAAIQSLQDFSEHYQAAVIQPKPLFRRRA